MKKILTMIAMLIMTMGVSAQTLIKGDMDGDGNVTIGDVTRVAATATGKLAKEEINIGVDYSDIAGVWDSSSNRLFLNPDGTTDTWFINYKYIPGEGGQRGLIYVYMTSGEIVNIYIVHELTATRLVVSDYKDYNGSSQDFGTKTTYTRTIQLTSLSISPTSITAEVGETRQITLTYTPEDASTGFISWASRDTNVATVSNTGLVNIVGPGSCKIVCSSSDGSSLVATCDVHVPQYVESITLPGTLLLYLDESYKMNAIVNPASADNTALTWSSSAPDIVSVSDDGVVTVKSSGGAVITCTAQDGTDATASCVVYSNTTDYEYVDLGLPSGTVWATTNVGGNHPEEISSLYAWGETTTKDDDTWATYKYAKGDGNRLTKYCTDAAYGDNGFVDNKTVLDPEDDTATALWGSEWCLPTVAQWQELIDNCECKILKSYVNKTKWKYVLTSKINGNRIILPPEKTRGDWSDIDWVGYFWTKELDSTTNQAKYFYLKNNASPTIESWPRCFRLFARAVRTLKR